MSEVESISREILLGSSEAIPFFTNVKGVFSIDAELVRLRIYSTDGKKLLGDIGVSPARARVIGARLIAGANKIDPQGALVVAQRWRASHAI